MKHREILRYYVKILIYFILNETAVILIVFPLFTKCNCNLNTLFFDVTVTVITVTRFLYPVYVT